MQAASLEKATYLNKTDIYSSKGTRVASYVLTIFTPAIYYLGYSTFQEYQAQLQADTAFIEIEQIRFRMAEKRCFEKK